MLEVAVGATMRCKITTYLQPPKGVLQLMLTNLNPAHSWAGRYVCGDIRAHPSRQSNLTLRYGRKICHRNFLNSQPVQKVQRRIKFFRFVRRLLKSVRLRSSFQRKDNACLSFPPNIFSRIYLKVVQVYQYIQLI